MITLQIGVILAYNRASVPRATHLNKVLKRLIYLFLSYLSKFNLIISFLGDDLEQRDAICQRALTQVIVAWQSFEDPETEVTR